jgi:hypothetical protein
MDRLLAQDSPQTSSETTPIEHRFPSRLRASLHIVPSASQSLAEGFARRADDTLPSRQEGCQRSQRHQPALFMTVRRVPHPSLPHTMGEGKDGGARQARGAVREGGILEQDVDRPSGEPAWLDAGPPRPGASPPRLRGRAPGDGSWRESKTPSLLLSAIAAEAFMNNAGSGLI